MNKIFYILFLTLITANNAPIWLDIPEQIPNIRNFSIIPEINLEQNDNLIKISNNKSKIKFEMNNSALISKVIDGRFPDYNKVIPVNNEKILEMKLSEFKNSIERVTAVSSDRKEGLKMLISKESVQFSVNNPNSGEGIENISARFNSNELNISFNSGYLIDIASQIENESIVINLKDPGSPVLIRDISDKNSFHVVMPMKI